MWRLAENTKIQSLGLMEVQHSKCLQNPYESLKPYLKYCKSNNKLTIRNGKEFFLLNVSDIDFEHSKPF